MSGDDVHPDEMNGEPPDLDDAASEELLRGAGAEVDPAIAQVIADMRTAFTSKPPVVGAELAALMAGSSAVNSSAARRKFERLRSSMIAKIAAGAAAAMAATGGLAVAGALPAPVQHVFSAIGIGSDSPHHTDPPILVDSSTETKHDDETGTTLPGGDNGGTTVTSTTETPGTEVSGVTHNNSQTATTTLPGEPSPPTIAGTTPTTGTTSQHQDGGDQGGDRQGNDGDGHDGATPTTTTVASTPTTTQHHHPGDGDHGNHGGHDH